MCLLKKFDSLNTPDSLGLYLHIGSESLLPREGKDVLSGRDLIIEGVGMPVVSLRGVNLWFWSHLGCSGGNAVYTLSVAVKVSFWDSSKEIQKCF